MDSIFVMLTGKLKLDNEAFFRSFEKPKIESKFPLLKIIFSWFISWNCMFYLFFGFSTECLNEQMIPNWEQSNRLLRFCADPQSNFWFRIFFLYHYKNESLMNMCLHCVAFVLEMSKFANIRGCRQFFELRMNIHAQVKLYSLPPLFAICTMEKDTMTPISLCFLFLLEWP